ncbi:MAG: preprotein translocase subunit YajC [Gemmatimonadales bacterium]
MTTLASLSLLLFAPSGQGGPGFGALMIQIALFIAIFYFLLIRPQRRQREQHEQLLKALQRGDKVVTSGGIVGEEIHIKDDQVTLRSGESRLVVMRSGIASITEHAGAAPEATPA